MLKTPPDSIEWIALTCPKVRDQANEDQYQVSPRTRVFALSDGATVSFDSETWAKILVRGYARDQGFSEKWLADAIRAFNLAHDRDSLPWMKQAALDRGSFASLVGLTCHATELLAQIFAVGDSVAVLCDGDSIKSSFPYTDPREFDQHPQLLSTQPTENGPVLSKDITSELTVTWQLWELANPLILLATDALGRWLLEFQRSDPNPVDLLRRIVSLPDRKLARREFVRLVLTEREVGRLRKDDTTVIAVWGMNGIPTDR